MASRSPAQDGRDQRPLACVRAHEELGRPVRRREVDEGDDDGEAAVPVVPVPRLAVRAGEGGHHLKHVYHTA